MTAAPGDGWVDLRSDTVTKPSPEMRRAMADAEVGDDVYGEDPTVNALQERFAGLLGTEAALFVPSGTMGNQIALRLLFRPGTAAIAGRRQHIVCFEAGAAGRNTGVQFDLVDDADGTFGPHVVDEAMAAAAHRLRPSVVCVEDTHLPAGGAPWPVESLAKVGAAAAEHGLPLHIDGARLWHAAVADGVAESTIAAPATTVTCCLSKALGAPVGSVLGLPAALVPEARLERQRLGGAMRQAGVLAAAGLVALDHRPRLAADHERAQRLARAVAERWPDAGCDLAGVRTNIVLFRPPDADGVLAGLRTAGIRAGTLAPGLCRFVTHRDVDDAAIDRAVAAIRAA